MLFVEEDNKNLNSADLFQNIYGDYPDQVQNKLNILLTKLSNFS